MNYRVGTAFYMSPEILQGNYTEDCDVWSLGNFELKLYIIIKK